jgi:GNAT superfamily N-acetyltransferase
MPQSLPADILDRMSPTDPHTETVVRLLDAADSDDAQLVERLTGLINDVYKNAESGLWRNRATRTTASEIAELIAARQIAVATRHGQIAGSVRIHDVSGSTCEFGMLVAAPEQRSTGVGRALIDFAERHARECGRRAIQLELLVPRNWSNPSKEFLKSWYGRRGYRLIRTDSIDHAHPHLAPLLATPCDLTIYEKPLHPEPARSEGSCD